LAKKRIHIVNEILEATLSYFPDEIESHGFHKEIAQVIETFFLLDHCVEDSHELQPGHKRILSLGNPFKTAKNNENDGERKPTRQLSLPAMGEQKLEAVGHAVGNAVGSAVENVGSFFKASLGDKSVQSTPKKTNFIETAFRSPVVPYTRKSRRSLLSRDQDSKELEEMGEEANLLLDDERPPTELVPSYSYPVPTFGSPGSKLGDILETNPIMFLAIFVVSAAFLRFAGKLSVTMDLDIFLLLIWAAFCIGLHTPRPMVRGIDKSSTPALSLPAPMVTRIRKQDRQGRQLMRMTLASTPDAAAADDSSGFRSPSARSLSLTMDEIREDDEDSLMEVGQSPLPKFPEGAPLGSKLNCWSEPDYETFHVRGGNYLSDRVKEASGPFIFPIRAVDLFLTDACPENAGR
jgi:hypothetical protein